MHIPSGNTTNLSILSFDDSLQQAKIPCKDYDITQWLYVPNHYADYRYLLGTIGANPLICIGINPSTAAPDSLDNTLKSVHRLANYNGYDSFMMFNVYAQRATNPKDMEQQCNPYLHQENMKAFRYILQNCSNQPAIWAAWGTIIEARQYLSQCLLDMVSIGEEFHAQWFTAGSRSKKGHPHHPLYLRKDTTLDSFDVQQYLSTCL